MLQVGLSLLLWQIPASHWIRGAVFPTAAIGREAIVAMCWGTVLGGAAARAFQKRRSGDWAASRRICLRAGGTCLLLNGLWILLMGFANVHALQTAHLPLDLEWTLRLFVFPVLGYIPLQVSALLWIAGLVLPKRESDALQVTEKLRL